jgi:hypothetical protein
MIPVASLPASLRKRRLLPWALPCLALLVAGDLWRFLTFHVSRDVHLAYSHLAYSDIYVLYFSRHLASHQIPYIQTHVEYPVVTGFIMWLTAFAPGVDAYFWVNAVLLIACAVGSLVLLSRITEAGGLWRFALAPMLLSYGALNWDMVSVLQLVAALYFIRRRSFGWAGVTLALGTWTKLYPGFALPIVFAYALRLQLAGGRADLISRKSRPVRLLAAFLGVTIVLNLPVALINFQGWAYPIVFQGSRGINPDSIWFHVPNMTLGAAVFWFATLFICGMSWIIVRAWSGDRWEVLALLAILSFLVATRDYSPQYDLWILPLLVLLACPLWLWLAYATADLAYYAGIFWWLYQNGGGSVPLGLAQGNVALGAAVWGREIALALLVAWALSLLVRSGVPQLYVKVPGGALLREEIGHADVSEG